MSQVGSRATLDERVSGRSLVILLLVALSLVTSGVAGAYWSGQGAGGGTGTSGTAQPVTLTPATVSVGLYPGAEADVVLTVSNPNASEAVIGSFDLDEGQGDGGFAVDAAHSGCAMSALSYTPQSNTGAGWTVPATNGDAAGTLSVRLRNALAMGPNAANACQGASLTVYLEVGP